MKPDQVIGVGIDGSHACDAFGSGQPTGFRGTLWIDSGKEGATSVNILVASIKENTPLPEKTYVSPDLINAHNFAQFEDKICHPLIRQLADSGLAILVISSEMPELIGLSDRIVVMASGRVVAEVDRADATEEGILASAMADNFMPARTNP